MVVYLILYREDVFFCNIKFSGSFYVGWNCYEVFGNVFLGVVLF